MGGREFEGIDVSAQQAQIWIDDLERRLDWDKLRAFRFLTTILRTLRDQLPLNEATDLGAQLPTLIRGIYYDQWRPVHYISVKDPTLPSFLDRIESDLEPEPIGDTSEAVSAVFGLLSEKISVGEITNVRRSLPTAIHSLWPSTE
jgi:uncharacterized protein (DUF2267 family)